MKRIILICAGLTVFAFLYSQEQLTSTINKIDKSAITIRPNSRDYTIVRIGNNYQRTIQIRRQAMLRYKRATNNRKIAIQRRRNMMISKMARQRRLKQRIIHQRARIIQQRRRMNNR